MNLGRAGGDDASALAENRRRLQAFLPAPPIWLDQVHGNAVATLTRQSAARPAPVADAAVTRERGVVCAVLTADCLPVLFADGSGTAVGVAHAGWRGLAAGVLEATIAALRELGVRGPTTSSRGSAPRSARRASRSAPTCATPFARRTPARTNRFAPHEPGKWHADLYGLARRRLARGGVTRVSGGGYCTCTDAARFFSYRRERDTGRMAAVVWLAPD